MTSTKGYLKFFDLDLQEENIIDIQDIARIEDNENNIIIVNHDGLYFNTLQLTYMVLD